MFFRVGLVMLRVAYVYDRFLPVTAADSEQALNTVSALTRKGVHVTLFLPMQKETPLPTPRQLQEHYHVAGDFETQGVPICGGQWLLCRKLIFAWQVSKNSALDNFDVVYTRNAATMAALIKRKRRVFYDTHRAWPDHIPPLKPIFRKLMASPYFVGAAFHSDYARKSYIRLGVPAEKLLVAHNGYEPARVEPALSKADARKKIGLPEDAFIVTYTGHVNSTKGMGALLELAKKCPTLTFLLVGSEREGAIERKARALANVKIFPWQSFAQLVPFLYASDVLCIPPSSAPLRIFGHTVLPLKIFLYLAVGRPIFGPQSADIEELLTHDKNALLVDAGNLERAAVLLKQLAADLPKQQELSLAALQTSKALTWDSRATKLEAFIQTRLAQSLNV